MTDSIELGHLEYLVPWRAAANINQSQLLIKLKVICKVEVVQCVVCELDLLITAREDTNRPYVCARCSGENK